MNNRESNLFDRIIDVLLDRKLEVNQSDVKALAFLIYKFEMAESEPLIANTIVSKDKVQFTMIYLSFRIKTFTLRLGLSIEDLTKITE